jgi:uncharacterized RDD family membrane protein YckC
VPVPVVQGRPLAPVGYRLLARLVDWFALLGLNIVVNGWLAYQWAREAVPAITTAADDMSRTGKMVAPQFSDRLVGLQIAILAISMALWLAYEVPTVAGSGQTPGKRALGIKVVSTDGSEVGLRGSMSRWSVQAAFGAIGVGLFGLLGFALPAVDGFWCVRDARLRQCLHDKVAGTSVVLVPLEPTGPKAQDHRTPPAKQAGPGQSPGD